MIALIIVGTGSPSAATDTTPKVYPSEDELREALDLGEITTEEYGLLLERLRQGEDSVAIDRQAVPVERPVTGAEVTSRVTVTHRYACEMDAAGRGKYRTSIKGNLSESAEFSLRIDRTLTGRERLIGRSFRYRPKSGMIRELVAGTFSRRMGLGTVVGYRGKLLERSTQLDRESFLYPDYGGHNGGYFRLSREEWAGEALVSSHRDREYRTVTAAVMISRAVGGLSPALQLGLTRLYQRGLGTSITDLKYAATIESRYGNGWATFEATGQAAERPGFAALLVRGRHDYGASRIRYTGWWYGRHFLDLAAGSPTGPISVEDSLADVNFSFRSRRRSASGGEASVRSRMSETVEATAEAILSRFNRDTLRLEMASGFVWQADEHLSIGLEGQTRRTRRRSSGNETDDLRHRLQCTVWSTGESHRMRGRVSITDDADRGQYLSLFLTLRIDTRRWGTIDCWSNFGRIYTSHWTLDYWYGFLQISQPVFDGMRFAFKAAHRYNRGSSSHHTTLFTLEVEAWI